MSKLFQTLRAELVSAFPERQSVVDGALAAVLCGEHVLLLGPPGTGKSALVRSLAQLFSGRYFERLVTRFSTPEELFGPISLKACCETRAARCASSASIHSRRESPAVKPAAEETRQLLGGFRF